MRRVSAVSALDTSYGLWGNAYDRGGGSGRFGSGFGWGSEIDPSVPSRPTSLQSVTYAGAARPHPGEQPVLTTQMILTAMLLATRMRGKWPCAEMWGWVG